MKKFRIVSFVLLILTILLNKILSYFGLVVRDFYSNGINKYMVNILSKISGIVPFSIFEVLIYLAIIGGVGFVVYFVVHIIKIPTGRLSYFGNAVINLLAIVSLVYSVFILFWGINYNRVDLKTSLIGYYDESASEKVSDVEYGKDELVGLYGFLIEKTNELRKEVLEDGEGVMKYEGNYKSVISRGANSYKNVSLLGLDKLPNYSKAKPIMNSNLLCYTGITGIYSPFTGEANVNIASPDYYLPFTTLHEMAHQRGYASEDEANFIAYIVGINHKDIDYIYSSYIMGLKYTSRALSEVDREILVEMNGEISDDVLRDLAQSSAFWKQYEGKVNEVSDNMNNTYLKANGVASGTESYGEMVNLLLTYYGLYGYEEN